MSDPLVTLTGNGTIGPTWPGWNVKFDATPEAPGDSSGSTGGMSFTARHGVDSEYVVDNYLDFRSDPYGTLVRGRVTGVVSNGELDANMTSVDLTVDSIIGALSGTNHVVGSTGEFTKIARITSGPDNSGRTIVGSVVDDGGNVHVLLTGTSGDMVQIYDKYGMYYGSWGAYGVGSSGIYNPTAIAIDNVGKFYIGNGAFRVSVFDTSANSYAYITNFGTSGTGNGQFQAVTAISAFSASVIYVTDAVQNRVQKFNGSYVYQTKWGSTGTGNSQFLSISGVTATATEVWIADNTGNAIKVYSPTGTWSNTITVTAPRALSNAGGYAYATRTTGLSKFDMATKLNVDVPVIPEALNSIPVNSTGLYMVEQVMVDPNPGDFALFNAIRFSRYFGPVEPLLSDVVYYYIACGLGQELPVYFGDSLTWSYTWNASINPTVSIVGWGGEIWNHIKQIMSAYGIELLAVGSVVLVRDIGTTTLDLDKAEAGSVSIALQNSGSGQSVDFKNYNTSRSSGEGIMYDSGATVYSINIGQSESLTVSTDSSPNVVSSPTPTDLTTGPAGTYYVTDSDGVHIPAASWTAAGGYVTASLSATPGMIDLFIKPPLTAPDGILGPYYFALYNSGERISRFSVKGTGIISDPVELNILSGADPNKVTQAVAFGVDNIAHTSKAMVYKRCSWALANASGPTLKLVATVPSSVIATAVLFGMVTHRETQFRVVEISFGEAWSRITALRSINVDEFDTLWNGTTVGTFDAQWNGKDFSDLRVKTLRKA